jgi:hypothetical protein
VRSQPRNPLRSVSPHQSISVATPRIVAFSPLDCAGAIGFGKEAASSNGERRRICNAVARNGLVFMQSDRRKNFRCPPSSDVETVVLRHKGVDRTANVVNLSAQGFRISLEAEDGIEPAQVGDVALLGTRHGSHQVRVANTQCENGAIQLGLERLADFSRPSHRGRREDPSKGHVGGGRRFGSLLRRSLSKWQL